MTESLRGADIVARTLQRAGIRRIFTLSGNHIMSIFDGLVGSGIDLVHTRHEGAAVYMAGAWARLTGEVGIAMVTGGPGHTNAASALYTALASEMPMVLISGHAGTDELGRGGFQEVPQAEMAATVSKASWMSASVTELGHDLALAIRIAASGRPGPVHLSLPSDLLDGLVEDDPDLWPADADFLPETKPLGAIAADAVLAAIEEAERPLILVGPQMGGEAGRRVQRGLEDALNVPVVCMESPRGLNDPTLGAFAEALRQADLIVTLGKPVDFTLKFAEPPGVDTRCRFVMVDPEVEIIDRLSREKGERLILSAVADPFRAAEDLMARGSTLGADGWLDEVRAAVAFRPPEWDALTAMEDGKVHSAEFARGVRDFVARHPNAVFICDGGEIGQWTQALVDAPRRITNGVAGGIGVATPFAVAAATVETTEPVVVVMGDGTFGFHMAEFDTAVRCGLPVLAVVGTDGRWNAEHQIQLREYGENRAYGCDLLPSRYDLVVEALGGHGELVTCKEDLGPALDRARASGKPACVNVMLEGAPAPMIRRDA